jgi:molybdate transport system ATP-binding protein
MPYIQYDQADFSYKGKIILSDINFTISDGQHAGIVGAVGSGKSMLLKSLTGVLPLRKGARKFLKEGEEISAYEFSCMTQLVEFAEKNKHFKPNTHFYQQRYQSLEDDESRSMLVREYLALEGLHPDDPELYPLLERGELISLLDRKMIHISSGQRKRLQLTLAISKKPEVLLLDCPYTGVDRQSRQKLNDWLLEASEAYGIQLIIVANESDLPEFTDVIVRLKETQIQAGGSKEPLSKLTALWNTQPANPAFDTVVKMQDVKLHYGQVDILKGVSWQVNSGEKVGLQGKNGSGKSSLLSLIYGDNPLAYHKEIYLFDRKRGTGESIWDIKKHTGFVSSEFHLYMSDNITCEKLIATGYFDQLYIPRKITPYEQQIIDLMFEYFEVENLRNRLFDQISLGEQRLILLIRALIKNPSLILLDEPYQGFDQGTIYKANTLLEEMLANAGSTLIFISHDVEEMPSVVDKHYELTDGKVRALSPAALA